MSNNSNNNLYSDLKGFPSVLICGACISLGYHEADIPVEKALDNIYSSPEKMSMVHSVLLDWIYKKELRIVGYKKDQTIGKIISFWRLFADGTMVITAPNRVDLAIFDFEQGYAVKRGNNSVLVESCSNPLSKYRVSNLEYEQSWINKGSTSDKGAVCWGLDALENIPFEYVLIGKNIDTKFLDVVADGRLNLPKNIKEFRLDSGNRNFSIKNKSLCAYDSQGREYLIRVPNGIKVTIPNVCSICKDSIISFSGELVIPKTVKRIGYHAIHLTGNSPTKIIIKSSKIRAKYAVAISDNRNMDDSKPFFDLEVPGLFDFKEADNNLFSLYSGRCYYCGGKINKGKGCCSACGEKALSVKEGNKKYRDKMYRLFFMDLSGLDTGQKMEIQLERRRELRRSMSSFIK